VVTFGTQQNSRPSKNTQGSHNQQTKQQQKQPRATNVTKNNQRQLEQEERKPHYSEQQNPRPQHLYT
jgi:hypothetical protein